MYAIVWLSVIQERFVVQCSLIRPVPDVSYLFVTRRFVPGVLKEGYGTYLELGLGLLLMLGLGVSVRVSG